MAWLLTRAWVSGRRRDAAAAGVCWGLAVLTKSLWLVFIPFLGLIWWRGRRPLGALAATLAACALTVAPWTARNWFAFRAFVPVVTLGGVSFMGNSLHGLNPWYDRHPEIAREFYPRFPGDEARFDREIYRRKLSVLTREPLLAARILAVNFLEFTYPLQGAYYPRFEPGDPSLLNPALIFAYAGILLGLARVRGRPPPASDPRWIPIAMGAAYLLVALGWQGLSVYRLPIEPILLAGGLWGWVGWTRERPRGIAVAILALMLCWAARWIWTAECRRPLTEWICRMIPP